MRHRESIPRRAGRADEEVGAHAQVLHSIQTERAARQNQTDRRFEPKARSEDRTQTIQGLSQMKKTVNGL